VWRALSDIARLLSLDHLIAHSHLDLLDLAAGLSPTTAVDLVKDFYLPLFLEFLLGDDGLGIDLDILDFLLDLNFELLLFLYELLLLDHPVNAVLNDKKGSGLGLPRLPWPLPAHQQVPALPASQRVSVHSRSGIHIGPPY